GIRYFHVTGVQTCALPISAVGCSGCGAAAGQVVAADAMQGHSPAPANAIARIARMSLPPLQGRGECNRIHAKAKPGTRPGFGFEIGRASWRGGGEDEASGA